MSDLTNKSELKFISVAIYLNYWDDELFEDLDILGPEVKDLVNTNPKIARALIKLGDNFKQKGQEIVSKVENISGKIIDGRKAHFLEKLYQIFLQENKNYFPKFERSLLKGYLINSNK